MPKGTNQKLKLMYLAKIMLEKTDDDHSLTMPQILKELEAYDITAERKSIYTDFDDLRDKLKIDIIKEQVGRETYYHVGGREFELAEVKLIIDLIESSKFITETKSRELIDKVKKLASDYQARQLVRQIYISDRVKTMNEGVFYNVDEIHNAINENKMISFNYYKWNLNKELVRSNSHVAFYVSPWALTWDDENYYLIGYDDYAKKIKHYRVDKMMQIDMLDRAREGRAEFEKINMSGYSKAVFGMFIGEKSPVRIEFKNERCGVLLDRFGTDINFKKVDDTHSEVVVSVNVSDQFFGWVASLGNEVRIVGPESIVNQMKEFTENLYKNYH